MSWSNALQEASRDTKGILDQTLGSWSDPTQVAPMISLTQNYETTNAVQKEEQSSRWVQLESNRGVWSHLHVWWVSDSSLIAQRKVRIMATDWARASALVRMRESHTVGVPSSTKSHRIGVSLKAILRYLLPWQAAIHRAETPGSRQTQGAWRIIIFLFLFLPTVVSERSWVGQAEKGSYASCGEEAAPAPHHPVHSAFTSLLV